MSEKKIQYNEQIFNKTITINGANIKNVALKYIYSDM